LGLVLGAEVKQYGKGIMTETGKIKRLNLSFLKFKMVFYACCAGCVLKSTTDIHTQG
jgi:hypothetical protein